MSNRRHSRAFPRRLATASLCALLGVTGLLFGSASSSGSTQPAAQVAAAPAQTMTGFGASGAWWPQDLGQFPPSVQQRVASLLFSQTSGIGLSIYRYNIGAGGLVKVARRYTQTFLVQPGRYDWSRDPGGVAFLRLAQQSGVPTLVGFANSAP